VTASVATEHRPSHLGLLRERDFRLLWLGETTSSFGSSVGRTSLPLVAVLNLHASVEAVSLITAFAWLPWLIVGVPAGAWVDRWPRRRVMMTADAVSGAAFAAVVVAAATDALTTAQLLAATFVAGAADVFFQTAYRAFVPAVVRPDDLLEGNAKLQGSDQVARLAGPGIAGVLAQAVGAVAGVATDAVSFVASWACLRRLRVTEPPSDDARRRLSTEIAEGFRLVFRDPLLRPFTVFGCLSNLFLTGYQAIQVVFLVRVVGASTSSVGLVLALGSAGGVAGALLARPIAARIGTGRALLLSKTTVAPAGLLMPLAQDDWRLALFAIGSFVLIGGIVAGNVIWAGFAQSYYPSRVLGRMSTSGGVLSYGAIPIGAAGAGVLAGAVGTRPAMAVILAGLVLTSLVLIASPLRTMRDLPRA
jgi:Na+/melibiose symporter-like transporter